MPALCLVVAVTYGIRTRLVLFCPLSLAPLLALAVIDKSVSVPHWSISAHSHCHQPTTSPWDLCQSFWPWSYSLLQVELARVRLMWCFSQLLAPSFWAGLGLVSHFSWLPASTLWSGLRLVICLWAEKCSFLCILPSGLPLLHGSLRFCSSLLVPPVREFPSAWKLFLLHDSLPPLGHRLLSWSSLSLSFNVFIFSPTSFQGA